MSKSTGRATVLNARVTQIAWMCVSLAAGLAGCGPVRPEPPIAAGLQSEHPGQRIAACRRAAEQRDRSVLPLLVDRLEDPFADVRFFAIRALTDITGRTLGYKYYAGPRQRARSVRQWRGWLARHKASGEGG